MSEGAGERRTGEGSEEKIMKTSYIIQGKWITEEREGDAERVLRTRG